MIELNNIRFISTVPDPHLAQPIRTGNLNGYPFIMNTGKCYFYEDNTTGKCEQAELVQYTANAFCTRSEESILRCCMSWGYTGCMFIVERKANGSLIAYHLTLPGGETSKKNKIAMSYYIYTEIINHQSSFWGITPTLLFNPNKLPEKMWAGKDENNKFRTVMAISDNLKNMVVVKAVYANTYPNIIFEVNEIINVGNNRLDNWDLFRYLQQG
ncbi:hypothetical protein SAMN04487977_101425 [Treponema bryantii]|uniref:Uncharacterized protein n=1 Tax=Treponema bryantii TaxID=163 RepID=A0A1H9AQD4_9SPIR|nr:hypothetical protein [Treponema bryantii]SEP78869.1 hypothetical protein SAMN04487977_101425 [Treponema bryantii]